MLTFTLNILPAICKRNTAVKSTLFVKRVCKPNAIALLFI